MKLRTTLSIAEDFSKSPVGRFRSDGPTSGVVFREEHLLPALEAYDVVDVVLDGSNGYGSSFLEEAFGGLVRAKGISLEDFKRRVVLISKDDPTLVDEILGYVSDEVARQAAKHH